MTATQQHDQPPVLGIVPEPVQPGGDAVALTAPTETGRAPERGLSKPLRIGLGRLMSTLRGDKYMVDAYPLAGGEDASAPDDPASKAQAR